MVKNYGSCCHTCTCIPKSHLSSLCHRTYMVELSLIHGLSQVHVWRSNQYFKASKIQPVPVLPRPADVYARLFPCLFCTHTVWEVCGSVDMHWIALDCHTWPTSVVQCIIYQCLLILWLTSAHYIHVHVHVHVHILVWHKCCTCMYARAVKLAKTCILYFVVHVYLEGLCILPALKIRFWAE